MEHFIKYSVKHVIEYDVECAMENSKEHVLRIIV